MMEQNQQLMEQNEQLMEALMQAKTQKGGEKLSSANCGGGGSNDDHEKTYTWEKCKLCGKRHPGGSKSCWTLTKNKEERPE